MGNNTSLSISLDSNESNKSFDNKSKKLLPRGKYTVLGISIDTTGRRFNDNIIGIAAYTPDLQFKEYIMPERNLNHAVMNRIQLKIVQNESKTEKNLVSMKTNETIPTKSELDVLNDFLNWLKTLKKNDGTDGIILVYYENPKYTPFIILETFKKHNLLEKLMKNVKSFVNGYNLVEKDIIDSKKKYTLRELWNFLNNSESVSASVSSSSSSNEKIITKKETYDGIAIERAKLIYDILTHLSNSVVSNESKNNNDGKKNMLNAIHKYSHPINNDLEELQRENHIVEIQLSFRPIFMNHYEATRYHRQRAVKLRNALVKNNLNVKKLNDIWLKKGKESLSECIKIIDDLKDEDKMELIDLLDCFFDPSKETIKPILKGKKSKNKRKAVNKKNKETKPTKSVSKNQNQNVKPSTEL